jgi:hypothetical protein
LVSAVKLYGLKAFFAAAFALTLALKLLLYYREFLEHQETAPADHRPLSETVAAFLLQHGFETHLEERFGQFLVHANAGKCRILISEADPQKSGAIELLARPVGPLSYVFDGAVHEHEPSPAWAMIDCGSKTKPDRGALTATAEGGNPIPATPKGSAILP